MPRDKMTETAFIAQFCGWISRGGTFVARSGGVAAIEFAVIAPLLALLLAGGVDIAVAVRGLLEVQSAAAAGADYAIVNGWNSTQIVSAITNGTGASGISAQPAPSVAYGCPTGNTIASATSSTICADGLVARSFVTVSASMTRHSLLGNILGLPSTLSATVVVQIP